MLAVSVFDLYMDPGDRSRWQPLIERDGVVRDFEVQFRKYDGTIIWVRDTGEAVRDECNRVLYYNGNVEDITDRIRVEEQLRGSERRLADIISFLPDATLVIDKNGVVLAWNRAMEKMTGIPVEQMIGKANYEYALPFYHERRPITVDLVLHYDPAVVAKYLNIKKEGSSLISEIFIPHLNKGKGAHLWFTASPLYDTAGNLTGAIESIRDITDRKIAEQLLHDAARNWQVTFNSTQDAICLLDADQRIVMCNRAMQEILGAKNADDLIGRHCWEVVHGTGGQVPAVRISGCRVRISGKGWNWG